jgi:hypothetical protein
MKPRAHDFERLRRIAAVVIACALIVTSAGLQPAAAAPLEFGPQTRNVAPAGANAMLRYRAPFGGTQTRIAPTFTFTAGPVWREQDGSWLSSYRFHNSSVIEIGIDGSGLHVSKLAGIDFSRLTPNSLNAEATTSDRDALWLVLGGAVILGSALGIYSMLQDECGNKTLC